jgi:uncharacterized protein YciW
MALPGPRQLVRIGRDGPAHPGLAAPDDRRCAGRVRRRPVAGAGQGRHGLRALHTYALALTTNPSAVQEVDVHALLAVGLSQRDVIDANQVVAYFNYVNRVASGLGVQLEGHNHGHSPGG